MKGRGRALGQAAVNVEDRGFQFGDGIYEVVYVMEQSQTRARWRRSCNRPQQIAIQNATVQSRQAMTEGSESAELDQAVLNRSYTKIVAPIDGVIGLGERSPNGQQVAPGQQLMVGCAAD